METKIIMLSGKQGSGKDTIADTIAEFVQCNKSIYVVKLKFASTIYEMHDACLKILESRNIFRPEVKKDGPLLQLLGTEWGRLTIDKNIWVECLQGEINNEIKKMGNTQCKTLYIFITDCRFPNEFDGVTDAYRVRLECDREIRKSRADGWRESDTHLSETALDEYSAAGKFDLTLDTYALGKASCAKIILNKIRDDWKGARSRCGS